MNVHGAYNRCPVAIFVASPDHAPVGQPILLTTIASDADGDMLSYSWRATSGSFANASSPSTTFQCATNGAVTITLTVSDPSCRSEIFGVLLCQPNDAGQPNDGGAPDVGASGAGGGGAGTGGQGGASGSAGSGGTGAGLGGLGGGLGGGMGGGMGGSGASGGTTGGASGGTACRETEPPASIAEACAACIAMFATAPTDGCCRIEDSLGLQLCRTLSACIRAAHCSDMGDATACYCGTNIGTCDMTGQANGSCAAQVAAAAGRNVKTRTTDTPNPAQILSRFGDQDYAAGRAINIYMFGGGFCPTECEL